MTKINCLKKTGWLHFEFYRPVDMKRLMGVPYNAYRIDRDKVRNTLKEGEFIEVFVDAPIEVCEQRDPKGLYKKARAGEIKGFTGIDDPYEEPVAPELILLAAEKTPDILADEVIRFLQSKGIL